MAKLIFGERIGKTAELKAATAAVVVSAVRRVMSFLPPRCIRRPMILFRAVLWNRD